MYIFDKYDLRVFFFILCNAFYDLFTLVVCWSFVSHGSLLTKFGMFSINSMAFAWSGKSKIVKKGSIELYGTGGKQAKHSWKYVSAGNRTSDRWLSNRTPRPFDHRDRCFAAFYSSNTVDWQGIGVSKLWKNQHAVIQCIILIMSIYVLEQNVSISFTNLDLCYSLLFTELCMNTQNHNQM